MEFELQNCVLYPNDDNSIQEHLVESIDKIAILLFI